jgi:gliding motility-associated-like protein
MVLDPTGGPFEHYNWNTGDSTQSISITEPGRYWLEATDQNGCKSVDSINVKNSKDFIIFPNAFTPNADGLNDIFRPLSSNISKFHMSIYNRWGQLMFETSDMITGWNGNIRSEKCPSGLYVYVVDYVVQDAVETKTNRGSITLIR